jgi:plastocyanin
MTGSFTASPVSSSSLHIVHVGSFYFSPASLTVNVGDTIYWTWDDGDHTTTSDEIPIGADPWDSPMNSEISSFQYIVTEPGIYTYFCTPHASIMMGDFTASALPSLTASASATPASITVGQSSQLDVIASGGTGAYTYAWSSSPAGFQTTLQNPIVSPTVTTSFHCIVSSGSQTANTMVTVMVNQPVPQVLDIGDVIIPGEETSCYNATETITVGGSFGSFLVLNGGSVTMIAGQRIFLQPGTSVEPGGYLNGHITHHGMYCDVQPPSGLALNTSRQSKPENSYLVFPNPTSGVFTLEVREEGNDGMLKVEIFSMTGELVQSTIIPNVKSKTEFNLSEKKQGLYLLRIVSGKTVRTVRMSKL